MNRLAENPPVGRNRIAPEGHYPEIQRGGKCLRVVNPVHAVKLAVGAEVDSPFREKKHPAVTNIAKRTEILPKCIEQELKPPETINPPGEVTANPSYIA